MLGAKRIVFAHGDAYFSGHGRLHGQGRAKSWGQQRTPLARLSQAHPAEQVRKWVNYYVNKCVDIGQWRC